jgi:hypothetical protein
MMLPLRWRWFWLGLRGRVDRWFKIEKPRREWTNRFFKRDDRPRTYRFGSFSVEDVATICFGYADQIDRLTVSYDNLGCLIVRTLGARFTPEQITQIADYKPAGLLWEFEEAGEIYGKCVYAPAIIKGEPDAQT